MRAALGDGRRAGVLVALGVSTGATIWASAALFGLSLVFARSLQLAAALRVLGGLYLLYLGQRLWRGAGDDGFASLDTAGRPTRRVDARALAVLGLRLLLPEG